MLYVRFRTRRSSDALPRRPARNRPDLMETHSHAHEHARGLFFVPRSLSYNVEFFLFFLFFFRFFLSLRDICVPWRVRGEIIIVRLRKRYVTFSPLARERNRFQTRRRLFKSRDSLANADTYMATMCHCLHQSKQSF